MPDFSYSITQWFNENQRTLPWRETTDPYKIWLSEVILQQTQVAQGLPYYQRFVKTFPTVFALANASEEKVLKMWQGLGYYSRARNLHFAAKTVVKDYQGVFPHTYKELKKLKGVGDYTASAVASICFEEPTAVLDGNVFRVLARFWGIDLPINSTEGRKVFKAKAEALLDRSNPGHYNQAVMEFGALQCKPKNPRCVICPLQAECVAFQQGKVEALPVKLKKTKIRERHLNYIVFASSKEETVIQQRTGKGIWRNLYEFPLIETKKEMRKPAVLQREARSAWQVKIKSEAVKPFNEKPIKHLLSHQRLLVKFWVVDKVDLSKVKGKKKKIINWKEVEKYPVPAVIEKFLKVFEFKA